MTTPSPLKFKAEMLLLFVAVNWGLTFPFTKILLQYCSPYASVFYRFLITFALFMLFYRKIFKSINLKDFKYSLVLGILLFLGFITQTVGLTVTSASKSAFITGTYLIMLPFAQYIIIKKAPKKENVIGIIIVSIGLLFLTQVTHNVEFNFGDMLTLICAVFFALHIVFLDLFLNTKKADYRVLIFGQFLSMMVYSFFAMIIFEMIISYDYFIVVNSDLVLTFLFNAIVATLIGLILVNKFQRYTTPVKAGIIYSMEQVFAALSAFIILNEIMKFEQWIGAAIMLIGLAISEFYGYFRNKSKYGTREDKS